MNTYDKVTADINAWIAQELSKSQIVVNAAVDTLGWPYVFGGAGTKCTPANRKSYADRSSCPAAEAKVIRSGCQVLANKKSDCNGCQFYPGGRTLFFDCRGFTRWLLGRVGITLVGGGCTSQWNTASNWKAKGPISEMPDVVCCVFQYSSKTGKMEHTGMHIGGGQIIHCSGTVKRGKTSDKGWTHYGIPNGLEGDAPMPTPTPTTDKPTLRKGSTGEYVVECQKDLMALHYDIGASGADGKYGSKTVAAVKAFQQSQGLKADGICGPATWSALDAAVAGKEPAPDAQPQPEPRFTVTIRHLTKDKADELKKQFADAEVTEEKG